LDGDEGFISLSVSLIFSNWALLTTLALNAALANSACTRAGILSMTRQARTSALDLAVAISDFDPTVLFESSSGISSEGCCIDPLVLLPLERMTESDITGEDRSSGDSGAFDEPTKVNGGSAEPLPPTDITWIGPNDDSFSACICGLPPESDAAPQLSPGNSDFLCIFVCLHEHPEPNGLLKSS
jgi:hypothetical protein